MAKFHTEDDRGSEFRAYLCRLSDDERIIFRKRVIKECFITTSKYNRWSLGKQNIDQIYKNVIEQIAGEKIFS